MAFDGTNYLVVWQDDRSGSAYDIYGARVSRAGAVLDGTGIAISTAASDQSAPAVAFDGTNYLVVWQDASLGIGYDIYGARVSRAGAVLDGSGIPISTAANDQVAPAVAFDGTNYLVVWEDRRSGTSSDIYGARVSRAGAVLDGTGIAISTAASDQVRTGGGLRRHQLPGGVGGHVAPEPASRHLRGAGEPGRYGPRRPGIPISTAADHQVAPAVAFDGTNYLVVWQDGRSGTSRDIYGARVSRAGAVLDGTGIPISTAANDQYAPAVAFDGTNYLVVWRTIAPAPTTTSTGPG